MIDMNMTDEWGVPLWDSIKFIFDFRKDSIGKNEIGLGDSITEEKHLYEFLTLQSIMV